MTNENIIKTLNKAGMCVITIIETTHRKTKTGKYIDREIYYNRMTNKEFEKGVRRAEIHKNSKTIKQIIEDIEWQDYEEANMVKRNMNKKEVMKNV